MEVLVVVDMQNDFIDGALGTKEAQNIVCSVVEKISEFDGEAVSIVPKVADKIKNFKGMVLATRDTHEENYLNTQEGTNLPVQHCIRDTRGWELNDEIASLIDGNPIDKPTFGSVELGKRLVALNEQMGIDKITFVGLCTDICVISNAILVKAFLPEVPIEVDASCCAGVTPESHERALRAMESCQITIV